MTHRVAQAAIIVFDVSSPTSFKKAKQFMGILRKRARLDIVIVFVGNKCDLLLERKVTAMQVEEYVALHSLHYMEISAKSNRNITQLFEFIARKLPREVKSPSLKFCRQQQQWEDKFSAYGWDTEEPIVQESSERNVKDLPYALTDPMDDWDIIDMSEVTEIEEERGYIEHTLNRLTETFPSLAIHYNCTVEDILTLNGIVSVTPDIDLDVEGSTLLIPRRRGVIVHESNSEDRLALAQQEKRAKKRSFMLAADIRNKDVAKFYLEDHDYDLQKALQAHRDDLEWEEERRTGKPAEKIEQPKRKQRIQVLEMKDFSMTQMAKNVNLKSI